MPTWFAVVMVCCLIYAAFMVWAQVRFHSFRFALDYIQGARLQIQSQPIYLGHLAAGGSTQATVFVRNHTRQPVAILGALANCSCVASRPLPATIPPGGALELPISVKFPKQPGEWRQSVRYLTNLPSEPDFMVELNAKLMTASGIAKGPQ